MLIQSRGTANDLINLQDVLPGWGKFGSFTAHGTFGGVFILFSPQAPRNYPERSFVDVVPGRVALVHLRSPRGPAVDIANINYFASLGRARLQQIAQLRGALSSTSVACTILAGDMNCCAPGEGRYDLGDGAFTWTFRPIPKRSVTSCLTSMRSWRPGAAGCRLGTGFLGSSLGSMGFW